MAGQLPDQLQIRPPGLLAVHHVHQNERLGNELVILYEMPILRLFVVHDSKFQRSILQFLRKALFNSFVRVLLDFHARAAPGVGVEVIGNYFVRNVPG